MKGSQGGREREREREERERKGKREKVERDSFIFHCACFSA